MKREFLKGLDLGNGEKLPDNIVEAIMAEHGKQKQSLESQITTLTTDRDTWKTRAETAEAIVEKLPKDVDPATIGTVLKKAQDDLADAQFGMALDKALADVRFSSKAAKASIEADIRKQGLKIKDGTILGLNDYLAKVKEQDASAFAADEPTADPGSEGKEKDADKGKSSGKDADQVSSGKEQSAQTGAAGGARFTTKLGSNEGPKTKEDIMAIKDRKTRRAMIAEHMDLFEPRKEK